jgi:hypothetical protein
MLEVNSENSAHATDSQKLELARRRNRLQMEIDAFQASADTYFPVGYADELDADEELDNVSDPESEEEAAFFVAPPGTPVGRRSGSSPGGTSNNQRDGGRSRRRQADSAYLPEKALIDLPSRVGAALCREFNVGYLMEQELKLRIGQANEALHNIRIALVDKAILFRTVIRHHRSQGRSTRAWTQVHAVEKSARVNSKIYKRARKQMLELKADEAILSKYKVLKKQDLKISTAVAEPNARGSRNDSLAWFWSMDVQGDSDDDNWMNECELHIRGGEQF